MAKKHRNRNHNFSMRLREHHDALLDARKDEAGMTRSDYIRILILFAPAGERPRYSAEFAEEFRQGLNLVGNSINEITHEVHIRKCILLADLQALTEEFSELLAVYDKFVRDNVSSPY